METIIDSRTLPCIDVKEAMEHFNEDRPMYVRLALRYKQENAHYPALMKALGHGDFAVAAFEAHALKGLAGFLSFRALAQAARNIDNALRCGDIATALALLDPLTSAQNDVLEALDVLKEGGLKALE